MTIHNWTYDENLACVEQAFKSFVIEREYDYDFVISKLYIYFDGNIIKNSIKMKLQNIKYFFNLFNIPNTLTLAPLENVSKDNKYAFFAMAKKYNQKLYN